MKNMPPEALEEVAGYFQVLAEPTRLRTSTSCEKESATWVILRKCVAIRLPTCRATFR